METCLTRNQFLGSSRQFLDSVMIMNHDYIVPAIFCPVNGFPWRLDFQVYLQATFLVGYGILALPKLFNRRNSAQTSPPSSHAQLE